MSPEITDFFGKASIDTDYAIATTVEATRTAGVTVLEAIDLSKFADDTPVFFVTYKKSTDPVTDVVSVVDLVSWKGLVNAGANTITNLTLAPGYTDLGNDVGDFVECIPTSYWVNSLIDGIFVGFNPDGTLKDDTVDTDQLVDSAVETAKIANAAVTVDKLALSAVAAEVITSQTTTSTSFTDLATTTDEVTVTVGANGLALVSIFSHLQISVVSGETVLVGVALSGANTVAANDNQALVYQAWAANAFGQYGATFLFAGLTPGSTTFKLKYRTTAGTGTFQNRRLAVVPL